MAATMPIGRTSRQAYALLALLLLVGCGDTTDPLERKLGVQFALFEEAEQRAIERVAREGGIVERDEWERWLTPPPGDGLTAEDHERLLAEQAHVAAASRERSAERSVVDLDRLRGNPVQVRQYCEELPKGGMLHVHASGTRDLQTIEVLLDELDPLVDGAALEASANNGTTTMLYPVEVERLLDLPVGNYLEQSDDDQAFIRELFFLPEDPPTHPFERFEAIFSINRILLNGDPTRRLWVDEKTHLDFLHRAASLGVTYVEFTDVMTVNDPRQDLLARWAEEWLAETGITVRWNVAFVRLLPPEVNAATTRQLIETLEARPSPEIVGIDLLANETNAPALETGQGIYVPVRAADDEGRIDLRRTMHSGELGLTANPRDAILLGADRLGHGVKLEDDPVALEFARRHRDLAVEINLVSNLLLRAVDSLDDHPFLRFLRLGLPASLSTDDEGMFRTEIANECVVAIEHSDVTHAELKTMSFNSIATSFASDDVRERLFRGLGESFDAFEEKWRNQD